MEVNVPLFSGLSRVSTVPAGNAANAALVGANTVKGPGLFNVATRPAACTAATSVVWSFELTALSTMSFVGYIEAPPTIGFAACIEPAIAVLDKAIESASVAASVLIFIS